MELDKKKYAREEVEKLLSALSRDYENKLAEQKARISELVSENSAYKIEIASFEEKDKKISATMTRAEIYASDLKSKANAQYALAVENVATFLYKWNLYFDHIKQKYPMYPVVQNAVKIKDKIKEIIGERAPETVVSFASNEIGDVKNGAPFNPKEKIADYVAATSENGFSMDEVLNPGALRLEDLCKELGLLTEDDL